MVEDSMAKDVAAEDAMTEDGKSVLPKELSRNRSEDIAIMRAMGADVDDDNHPAKENITAPGTNTTTSATGARNNGFLEGQDWGWSGIDNRKKIMLTMLIPK